MRAGRRVRVPDPATPPANCGVWAGCRSQSWGPCPVPAMVGAGPAHAVCSATSGWERSVLDWGVRAVAWGEATARLPRTHCGVLGEELWGKVWARTQGVQSCSLLQAVLWDLLEDSEGAPALDILAQVLPYPARLVPSPPKILRSRGLACPLHSHGLGSCCWLC